MLNINEIRKDFLILNTFVHGKPLVYLDNAATTQKPRSVIEAVQHYYAGENANIHRGIHQLSHAATKKYENVRDKIKNFVHAEKTEEIVFVRGATEAINLVAQTYGRSQVGEGDEILVSHMEHHSNIVPWQMLCEKKGAVLKVIPINDAGEIILEEYEELISPRTKIVSVTHMSNALGTINPIKEIIKTAHDKGVPVLVDGAQAVSHMSVDVQDLDCDFYVFSAHKMFGPTGIGVLYGKKELMEKMPPYQGGGDMILSVTFEKTKYHDLPHKFEAGTPAIASVMGLGAAVDYIHNVGLDNVAKYEEELLHYATEKLLKIPHLRMIGTSQNKAGVLSFVMEGIHPHDVGTILDKEGIAVRAGHHCAQPVMDRFQVPATSRASLALYNTRKEIDLLAQGLLKVLNVFK